MWILNATKINPNAIALKSTPSLPSSKCNFKSNTFAPDVSQMSWNKALLWCRRAFIFAIFRCVDIPTKRSLNDVVNSLDNFADLLIYFIILALFTFRGNRIDWLENMYINICIMDALCLQNSHIIGFSSNKSSVDKRSK